MKLKQTGLIFLFLSFSVAVQASLMEDVADLQTGWAKANYLAKDKEQKTAFETLIKQADGDVVHYPNKAENLIWRGIIKSTYAGIKGGLGAMSLADQAKDDLEKAIKINDRALSGSAYASLATLYFRVPGWPIGFGDDDKAKELFQKALVINPNSIDNNYLYAQFLMDQGHYKQAEEYLLKAKNSPARPERPIADKGRHQQIEHALKTVKYKMKSKNKPF